MPSSHRGKKWATLHKFGTKKSKRRKKTSEERPSETATEPQPKPSGSDTAVTQIESSKTLHVPERLSSDSETVADVKKKRMKVPAEETPVSSAVVNIIVNLKALETLFEGFNLKCRSCKKPSRRETFVRRKLAGASKSWILQVQLCEEPAQRMGSACHLAVRCKQCGQSVNAAMSSLKSGGTHYTGYDINRHIVAAASKTGIGFTQLRRFFTLLNLPPPMNLKTWHHYRKSLSLQSGACLAVDTDSRATADHVQDLLTDST